MPETTATKPAGRKRRIRHRGRGAQMAIYLGKFFRMFLYQNDWKVLPMAAVIAGLVGMVIKGMLFVTREGTLMGAFAMSCVAIWNGCFNSIQVICRERDVIKREHRSGMHISSYVAAHLIYQAFLCALQTIITVYICKLLGVRFPAEGLFTGWLIVDMGVTLFLISFASDALSLWVSSLARNTTTAMTIMPFVLIFQLVFSGVMLSLPSWSKSLSALTISKYGLTAIASQADYNARPMVSAWSSVTGMRSAEVGGTVTVGQVLNFMGNDEVPAIHNLRETELRQTITMGQLIDLLKSADSENQEELEELSLLLETQVPEEYREQSVDLAFTVGEIVDYMAEEPALEEERARTITVSTTVGEIIEIIGEDKAHWEVQERASAASYDEKYVNSKDNIGSCWFYLVLITAVCAVLTTVTLEFIDKDKR